MAPVTSATTKSRLIAARDAVTGGIAGVRGRFGDRAKPSFVIVGAQKAGTTFLYQELVKHPSIAPALTKEIHYFCDKYERGSTWYSGFFPRSDPRFVTGEASPSYLFHPHAAARMGSDLPEVRAIVVLRDPVRRAFSQYQHEVRLGFEDSPTFHEALAREDERVAGELERQLDDSSYVSFALRHFAYRQRGLYFEQVCRLVKALGRDRVLVLLSEEELYADPIGAIATTVEFLGLPSWRPTSVGRNDMASRGAVCDIDVAEDLAAFYAQPNAALAAFLGRDLGWT